ncbi:hypothetical protein D3C87_827560 [compost metagenome]
MDRGFIPPESDFSDLRPDPDAFMGEFGEREHPPTEVDPNNPRIEVEPDTGEIRPL